MLWLIFEDALRLTTFYFTIKVNNILLLGYSDLLLHVNSTH